MLKIVSLPKSPLSWIAVMLLVFGMLMFSQFFVSSRLLTQITNLTVVLFLPQSSG